MFFKKILYYYHRFECCSALKEADTWWFYADPGYWRFNFQIALKHGRKMWKYR